MSVIYICRHILCLFTLYLLMFSAPTLAAETNLSMAEAVALSLSRDEPAVMAYREQAKSVRTLSQSQSSLPDPKMKLGVANLPAHSFDYDQDPMAQIKIGLHQDIPSGTRRRLIRERGQDAGAMYDHKATGEQLLIIRDVRKLWLTLRFTDMAKNILLEKHQKLSNMIASLKSSYQTGQGSSQNILLLDAELSKLEDTQEQVAEEIYITRLNLQRYIGGRALTAQPTGPYGQLMAPKALSQLEDNLLNHPSLRQQSAKIRAESKTIGLAREDYKPNWGFDVGYGLRGRGRSDLLTAMVTFDLPIFTKNRQDKKLYAAQRSKQAAELTRAALEQDMHRNLRVAYAKWHRTSKRLTRHVTDILPKTASAAQAIESSFATGGADFEQMVRLNLGELDIKLKIEELKMIRAQAQADLAYFTGEAP